MQILDLEEFMQDFFIVGRRHATEPPRTYHKTTYSTMTCQALHATYLSAKMDNGQMPSTADDRYDTVNE